MNNNIYNDYYTIIKYLNEINNNEYLLDEFKFFDAVKSYLKQPGRNYILEPVKKDGKNIIEKIIDKINNGAKKLIDKLSDEANTIKELNDKQQLLKLPRFKNEKYYKSHNIHISFSNPNFFNNIVSNKNEKNKLTDMLKKLNNIFEKSLDKLRIRFIADIDKKNVRPFTYVSPSQSFIEKEISTKLNNIDDKISQKLLKSPLYKEFLKMLYTYSKGHNITFSRSKHTINFNMDKEAEIYIGEKCFKERSSDQLVATCLHELGHHVFTKLLAFRNASKCMINFSKNYLNDLNNSILNPDNDGKYLQKSKLYSLKILIGFALYFSYFINYFTTNNSEKAADDFCVMCGYGKYLSKNIEPYAEKQKKMKFSFEGLKNIFAKNKKISDVLEYLGKWINTKASTSYYTNAELRTQSLKNNDSKTINDQEFYDSLDSKLVTENIELVLELFTMFLDENYGVLIYD